MNDASKPADTTDSGDPAGVIDTALKVQTTAYHDHLGDPDDFSHRDTDTPVNRLPKRALSLLASNEPVIEEIPGRYSPGPSGAGLSTRS